MMVNKSGKSRSVRARMFSNQSITKARQHWSIRNHCVPLVVGLTAAAAAALAATAAATDGC